MRPVDLDQAAAYVKDLAAVVIGPLGLDPSDLIGPIDLVPANLSAEFLSGTTIGQIQTDLAPHGLWWPVDADHSRTLGAVLATAGPYPGRTGYGPVRDWVLGLEMVLTGGQRMRLGAPTMKNVAGYDLTRLMVGSRGTLGLIGSATLRLLPLPQRQQSIVLPRSEWARAAGLVTACEWNGETLVVRLDGSERQVTRRLAQLGGEVVGADCWDTWHARALGRYVHHPKPDWGLIGSPLAGLWRTDQPYAYTSLERRIREAVAPGRCFNPDL